MLGRYVTLQHDAQRVRARHRPQLIRNLGGVLVRADGHARRRELARFRRRRVRAAAAAAERLPAQQQLRLGDADRQRVDVEDLECACTCT
jgi:hypothetical protein